MRKDFIKVLTERPRAGGKNGQSHNESLRGVNLTRYWEDLDEDGTLRHKGMGRKRRYWGNVKDFTDLLSLLKRYLRSNVGRPWDKVYSEVCKNLRADSVQGNHLRDHVRSMVTPWVQYEQDCKIYGYEVGVSYRNDDFYVDAHGILRECRKMSAKEERERRWNYCVGRAAYDGLSKHSYLKHSKRLRYFEDSYTPDPRYLGEPPQGRVYTWFVRDVKTNKTYHFFHSVASWMEVDGRGYHNDTRPTARAALTIREAERIGLRRPE